MVFYLRVPEPRRSARPGLSGGDDAQVLGRHGLGHEVAQARREAAALQPARARPVQQRLGAPPRPRRALAPAPAARGPRHHAQQHAQLRARHAQLLHQPAPLAIKLLCALSLVHLFVVFTKLVKPVIDATLVSRGFSVDRLLGRLLSGGKNSRRVWKRSEGSGKSLFIHSLKKVQRRLRIPRMSSIYSKFKRLLSVF